MQKIRSYSFKWLSGIHKIDSAVWDALAIGLKTPFLEWEWLRQMEASGSISPQTGWHPRHLTVWNDQRMLAAAPLYVKTHSEGEFVFDRIWVNAAAHLGISYYPKMVGMSPVTPLTGYRFLMSGEVDEEQMNRVMADEISRFCVHHHLSGCSFLFADPDWGKSMAGLGFIEWIQPGMLWENPGFREFDEYLCLFHSRQRHNMRREITGMEKEGIQVRMFRDGEIPESFIPLMYRFYETTNDQYGPWGCKYLNRNFFEGLYAHYRHRLLFAAACGDNGYGEPLGMAMLVHKGEQLFGRYWGSTSRIRGLHFNVCYYRPIEWAIENSIRYFDPGLGGEHKIRRGFHLRKTFSLHRFCDARLDQVMRTHIGEINQLEEENIDITNANLPFARRQDMMSS
ncbi:MAG: GNAT family N-acetyltransferase [Desulfococcaceae bacterium]